MACPRAASPSIPASATEEFPEFTEFWIEDLGDDRLIIYALLEGPSLTGAYAFDTLRRSRRRGAGHQGEPVPPQGHQAPRPGPDDQHVLLGRRHQHRRLAPEVHDSDGLAILMASGERIWRPLENPSQPRSTAFAPIMSRRSACSSAIRSSITIRTTSTSTTAAPRSGSSLQGDWGPGAVALYAFPTISKRSTTSAPSG
jgi:glucans biosynthesis protein